MFFEVTGSSGQAALRGMFLPWQVVALTAAAVGLFRGDTQKEFALRFERLEPYVIPKRSLTGDAIERVDTRVLQVLYEIVTPAEPTTLFVGQQMDVFIDVAPQP